MRLKRRARAGADDVGGARCATSVKYAGRGGGTGENGAAACGRGGGWGGEPTGREGTCPIRWHMRRSSLPASVRGVRGRAWRAACLARHA
eukprot:scaffold25308_cov124-Isochrysis_galbana.AAC.4